MHGCRNRQPLPKGLQKCRAIVSLAEYQSITHDILWTVPGDIRVMLDVVDGTLNNRHTTGFSVAQHALRAVHSDPE